MPNDGGEAVREESEDPEMGNVSACESSRGALVIYEDSDSDNDENSSILTDLDRRLGGNKL